MQDGGFDLPRWGFAFPGRLRDELTALALAGKKTTTAGLLVEYELDGDPVPRPRERSILLDSAERPVAIIETVACSVVRLADVDDRHAIDEGEGYANAREFRVAHERHWNGNIDELRERLGEPRFEISDHTPIVVERFRVLVRLDTPPRPVPVRLAAPSEIPVLAGVLARAFALDPMVRWPMVSGDALPTRIRTMFEIVDTSLAGEGWMYTAGEGLGAMSLMPPASTRREQELADANAPALAALIPDGGERYERFWAWVSSMLPPEPHWLLDQIAVEPVAQGRGIGGAILRFAIECAARQELPLCLETGRPGNVPLYQRFGFRVMREADAPEGGPHIWFMQHDQG